MTFARGRPRRILVTGACGFIGSHTCEALLRRGDDVIGVDNFNTFYEPALKEENRKIVEAAAARAQSRFRLVRGSILDEAVLEDAFGADASTPPDVVVHLAAWAGVRPSIERPALYARENVDGTVAIMDAIRAHPLGAAGSGAGVPPPAAAVHPAAAQPLARLVFASSSSVYGTNSKVPFHEDDPVDRPQSPYAATKRAGELLASTYHELYGIDVAALRFFTVYGPRQRPEMAIHKFAKLMLDGKPVPRFGDGKSARDYTFIADIVQGVLAAIDRPTPHGFRIYNLGNSRTITLDELIAALARALQVTPMIEAHPHQPGDVPLTYADIARARAELDYAPDYPLEKGLAEFAAWLTSARGLQRDAVTS